MDQKKEDMMGGGVEKRWKSKGEPEGGYQQCGSRSSEICSFDTGVTQHKNKYSYNDNFKVKHKI